MKPSIAAIGRRVALAGRLREAVGRAGLREARVEDLAPARALAARLIGPAIAPVEVLARLHAHTGYGVYVLGEEGRLSGALALAVLNRPGLRAVRGEDFDPVRPALDHIASREEAAAAIYGWGVVGATPEAARAVVAASHAVLETVPAPFFARAATEAGLRMLTRIGFVPCPGSPSGLLWREGAGDQRRAA